MQTVQYSTVQYSGHVGTHISVSFNVFQSMKLTQEIFQNNTLYSLFATLQITSDFSIIYLTSFLLSSVDSK